jgi:hypothetical protein
MARGCIIPGVLSGVFGGSRGPGGKEEPVLNNLSYMSNFVVVERGIYFVAGKDAQSWISNRLLRLRYWGDQVSAANPKPWSYGMAISPDRRSLLLSLLDPAGSNLMFVENFR